jgi:hypothetical protein
MEKDKNGKYILRKSGPSFSGGFFTPIVLTEKEKEDLYFLNLVYSGIGKEKNKKIKNYILQYKNMKFKKSIK